jgi:hypothetical protein
VAREERSYPVLHPLPAGTQAITLRHREDGSVELVGAWPETAVFAQELLDGADPALLRTEGDRLRLTLANGEAEYLVTDRDAFTMLVTASRLYARKEDGGGEG